MSDQKFILRYFQIFFSIIILFNSVFIISKSCQQIDDFVDAGKRYMQFTFVDEQGNCSGGYYQSYDDRSDGGLFCYQDTVKLDNKRVYGQDQPFLHQHEQSVHSMKQHELSCSIVIQQQMIASLYVSGYLTSQQAYQYEQMIQQTELLKQLKKQVKEIRKQDKKLQDQYHKKYCKKNVTRDELKKLLAQTQNKLPDRSCVLQVLHKVMHDRKDAVQKSLSYDNLIFKKYKIQDVTKHFLQAHNIDVSDFELLEGLPIQHQLTHELVGILDAVAEYAEQHHDEIYQTHLTKYCAHLASLSQQSNMQGALQQAIEGTNCCHGIEHYLKGMVSGVSQAYNQFQTALDYFKTVIDSYGALIVQHAAQGAMVAYGLEGIVAAGMIAAPTATLAATGMMIGATAYVMAPICFQGLMDLNHFGSTCILGDWNKVAKDLNNFGTFMRKPETVARMAEFAGGIAVPMPKFNYVVDQVLSLRPVLTRVQNETGQAISKLYVMSKDRVQQVYQQAVELLQRPEFIKFNGIYEKILGCHFFDILPKSHPAFVGIEIGLVSSGEQAALTNLFTQVEGSVVGDIVKSGASSIGSQVVQWVEPKDFSLTEVGKKMFEAISKPYEEVMFKNITKDYSKLISNEASKETIELFCRCYEISLVPSKISIDIERLHEIFKDKYLGLQEFSSENPYLTMQMKHIFYPSIHPKLDMTNQAIDKFYLNGFHHDEYAVLEQSGLFKFTNKIYGESSFGAQECIAAVLDWGDGIITKELKTFFPSNWSREKTVQVIFEAAQNRIEEKIMKYSSQRKFECHGVNNLIIEIIFDKQNRIISAYPSHKNFRI